MVTGVLERLKSELLYAIFSVGDFSDGLIVRTTSTAALAKNLLKLSAMIRGLEIELPLIKRERHPSFLFFYLRIALNSICQVLRRFFEFASI